MINALTFYTERELNKEGVSQKEFLLLRIAGLRGMRRGTGSYAWYDGAEVQKYQRIVNKNPTKAPSVKVRKSQFAKQTA